MCSRLIGYNMGEVKPTTCQSLCKCLMAFSIIMAIINCTIIIVSKQYIPLLFTSDTEVIVLIKSTYNIIILIIIFDAIKTSMVSIINGLGYQKNAFIISLLVLYFIYIPLSLTLIYEVNTGIEGVWCSVLTSLACLSSAMSVVIFCLDWDNIPTRVLINLRNKTELLNTKEE
jgi:MATE family multidrug resistance protein